MNIGRIGRVALAAAALWGFAATAAQAVEVSFWTWRQEDKAAYNELFADFTKANPDIFSVKVGLVEGKVVELKEVESIASLPSREDLLSKVLFLINAQAQRLVTVLQAVPRNLAVVTEQIRAQKEAQGA